MAQHMSSPFGALGAWLSRRTPDHVLLPLARDLESYGYSTIWVSGTSEPGVFDVVEKVLGATDHVPVATGVVNTWIETPQTVTDGWHRLEERFPGRLHIGLGVSHAPSVNRLPGRRYTKPLATMRAFLDDLEQFPDPLPPGRRLLGALAPKMLELAAERTLGTHPYLVTTHNTSAARAGVGAAVVAPELGVILDPDLGRARTTGREAISHYFGLPNYTNNWKRSGFTDDDLADGGSNRLIDEVLAVGDVDRIAARIAAHRRAGADHIAVQVLDGDPRPVFRALAGT